MKKYENPEDFWNTQQGKAILKEEREKTFAGEKTTVTMEEVDRIWQKYRDMVRSTEGKI